MQESRFVQGSSRIIAAILAVLTALCLTAFPASAAGDTVTVKSQSYSFSYNAGGTWTSDLDGFSVSDGSLGICTQLDVNPPGSGGTTYKLATNLGTSYTDGDKTISTKFAFKCMYYAVKNKSSNAALKDLDTYELSLATNCVVRGYFTSLTPSAGTNAFSQKIITAVQAIRNLANADADKIDGKISIKDGIATCMNGNYTARMAFFTSTGSQRVMIYDADWEPIEQTGFIEVNKKDPGGKALSGAVFMATNTSTNKQYRIGPTNTSGYAKVTDVPYGTYTVTETVFPDGYTDSGTTSWTVTLNAGTKNHMITINAVNQLKPGYIQLTKLDSTKAKMADVTYGIFSDKACTKSVGTMVTKADGTAKSGALTPGTYYVKEITLPAKYKDTHVILDTVYTVTVKADETATVNNGPITDPLKGTLSLTKKDDEGVVMPDVPFGLYKDAACKTEVQRLITDDKGEAKSKPLDAGTYYVKELPSAKYKKTHILNDKVYEVVVKNDQNTVVNNEPIINVRQHGSLTVHKEDNQTDPLAGAEFLLEISKDGADWEPVSDKDCTSKGLKDGCLTTGTDSIVTFDGLPVGDDVRYRLTETKAPKGYSLLAEPLFEGTLPVTEDDGSYTWNVSFTDSNSLVMELPATGGSGLWMVTLGAAAIVMLLAAAFFGKSKMKSY